ncbi:MAG: S26 family signal peptidase, partial [Phycisphaerales bacterium]|nr:S26 family signal peptidase [Phycisphaerales bacterium]
MAAKASNRETDIAETLQSLLVAFALALAFRGFVIEGFVIPTGSMAPTLMGQHVRFRSPVTGYEYAFDGSEALLVRSVQNGRVTWNYDPVPIIDPMVSQVRPMVDMPPGAVLSETRMGDRVLVLKFLYEFFDPDRWDVVVFKNPVDPIGPAQNYIKRLVGLAGEQVLLADGDVFTSEPGQPTSEMKVVRKPDYIQDAIWQPVYDSDFIPSSMKGI